MRILVLGASGMIGSAVLRVLSESAENKVYGSIRDISCMPYFSNYTQGQILSGIDVMRLDDLMKLFEQTTPDVVVNCIGLTKHKDECENPLVALPVNSLFPHRLAHLCKLVGARMIHVSTDCVFSGSKGDYREGDIPDAVDIYGRSKILGEVSYSNSITLRTSTIGHELKSNHGLLDWFLSQGESCKGFSRAIFSGLPTTVFAKIIRDIVIPHEKLFGLYHVAASPINKFELLGLIAKFYKKEIEIIQDDSFEIDRSLNADRFRLATGYEPPAWPELIKLMYAYK